MSNNGSLFNEGMKIMVYSENLQQEKGLGWHRDGNDILYQRNSFCKNFGNFNNYYNTLSYKYTFSSDNDVVYFAYNQPYTYSELT